jgi:hypothetical protein
MTRLTAKLLVATTFFLSATLLLGQSRGERGGVPYTRPAPSRAPGSITPPVGGYVPPPDSASPGTATASVNTDPVERAYWDLYDRTKHVAISGKVTRVNWTTPNSYFFVMANGAEWAIESSFAHFRQSNVLPAIKVGQTISVSGFLPKKELPEFSPVRIDASVARYTRQDRFIRANEITMESGQKLFMGKPLTEREEAEREKCRPLGC